MDFFEQPRAADMARMVMFLVANGGRATLREWEFHLGYSSRVAAETHEQMEGLGLLAVRRTRPSPRSPIEEIALTKEGEELGRALMAANAPYQRALAKARAQAKKKAPQGDA